MADLLTQIDYRIQGFHKDLVFDEKGDLVEVFYYRDYDPQTKQYSNLKVKESRTYTRAVSTLLEKREMLIEWYANDAVIASKNTTKYYSEEQGYKANRVARQNLIDKASMYLLSTVGLNNAKEFLDGVTTAISTYVDGNIQPLLDLISDSSEPYMTPTVKGTLDTILNISYSS
jgi:hypothetical protein